jgi:hypothetical protein
MVVSVYASVATEVERLPADLQESGLAAVALAMAERIDEGRGSPSECGKVLIDALMKLRDLCPPKQERTQLDDLADELAPRRGQRSRGAVPKNKLNA